MNKSKIMSVSIDKELFTSLKILKNKVDLPYSQLINIAIREFLDDFNDIELIRPKVRKDE